MMNIDVFESKSLETISFDISNKFDDLRSGFKSSIESKNGAYMNLPDSVDENLSRWLGVDNFNEAINLSSVRASLMDTAKEMYNGVDLGDGITTLGLKTINSWKTNENYYAQNIKQHAGYTAEVIGTAKENIKAKLNDTGVTTYRADDRPDLFQRNDQYTDKIRVNAEGEILERVQVKFVGKNGSECLSKLASKKFDKYFSDGMVDKMEVPKDYYAEMKQLIPDKISGLEEQLQHVKENGNTEAAQKIEAKIERYQKIDQMLEQSTVTSDEAIYATEHPDRYTAKLFAEKTFMESHKAGVESAAFAATITVAVSTIDNVSKVFDGEITPQEAFVDVAKDTATASGIAYGTAFVSTAVSQVMSESSHQLIKSIGSSGVPAAVISFGVQSYDAVNDYATGQIDGKTLSKELGENAAKIAGSAFGSALAGAAVGSIIPGAGTAVGFAAGMAGSLVGCALASEAYSTAIEYGVENADVLAEKAQEMAAKTVEIATEVVPDKVGNIIESINDFASVNKLPFKL